MTPLLLLVITVGCYIFYPPCEGALSSEPTDIKNDTTKSRIMGSKNVNKNVSQKIVNKKRHLSNMHRLIDDLLSNYDTSVVPTKSEKEKVEIRHLMVLNSIVQLDSKVSMRIIPLRSQPSIIVILTPAKFHTIIALSFPS